jgi:hypothetical protein
MRRKNNLKTKTLLKFGAALAVPVIYFLIISGFKTAGSELSKALKNATLNVPKDFVNYILNVDYFYYPRDDQMENFIGSYRDSLNFNGVHIYDGDSGTSALGWFNKPIEQTQSTKLNSLITSAHNNDLKAIFERSNISGLCYAQRLTYEIANGNTKDAAGNIFPMTAATLYYI